MAKPRLPAWACRSYLWRGSTCRSVVFSQLPVEALRDAGICRFSDLLFWKYPFRIRNLLGAGKTDFTLTGGITAGVFCNIHGRVCLPASIGFGLAGILVVRVILPFIDSMTAGIHPLLIEALALLFMLLFAMDLALTVSALTNFSKNLERIEKEINSQISCAYDNLENNLTEKKLQLREKSQQLQEGAFVRRELREERREERITALRERLTKERLENLLSSSSFSQKHTLLQIKGFRRSTETKNLRELLQKILH